MKEFIKFTMNVYRSEEMNAYMESLQDGTLANLIPIPTARIARVELDPDDIMAYHEVYSMDEGQYDPPKFDQTCIILRNGQEYQANMTLDIFKKELKRVSSINEKSVI